ncbi:MAG: hypothetical protein BWY38_03078 [Ignavibacteria bacterium ADurb.Bin266]|nr:MAG: hypothetical protein BWY38_03078 [Ignavibacteria bacterium ADurb.Bin266]
MMMAQQGIKDPETFAWNTIYTYTVNATATTVTAWIGGEASNDVTVPSKIGNTIGDKRLPAFYNSNSTFRGNTAVRTVNIEDNSTWFVGGTMNTMADAFNGCRLLTGVNSIPANVTNMYCTFRNCPNLVNAPTIPANVTSMAYTFYSCSNLVNAPAIPAKVTNMHYTFYSCSNLVNAPTIPANVTSMHYTFYSCSNLVNAPEIGQNVVNHHSTFKSCTNLAGNITLINTSVTEANMTNMFYGCNASIAKNLRCPSGSATYNSAINVVDGKNGVTVVAY